MSPNGCGGGEAPAQIPVCTCQNGSTSSASLVGGGAAASIGASRSCSSSIGPMYWPRISTSIASRGPPSPTGAARAIMLAFSAAGAVALSFCDSPKIAIAAAGPEQVGLLVGVDLQHLAGRQHDAGGGEVVTRQAGPARVVPDATAED